MTSPTLPLDPATGISDLDEVAAALDVARSLAAAGVPVFTAAPDPTSSTGYRLPPRWQQTRPDPAVVDTWRPGMALAVVMGQGLDLLDVDPRSGGDVAALNGSTPTSYAAALTPSGGVHSFIRSLGVRSRDAVLPGIDVKAGDAEGKGRGFAFIAPTVRVSKVTGEPATYRWAVKPDVARLAAVLRGELVDTSGEQLAALIGQVRSSSSSGAGDAPYDGPTFEEMPEDLQETVRQWTIGAVEGIRAELAASADWPAGHTDERGRGWEKLQADAALRLGRLARATWNDLELVDAEAVFLSAAPVDGTWGSDDVALKWRQQSGRLDPAPWPELTTEERAARDEAAWARLGVQPQAASAPAGPGGPGAPPPGGTGAGADGVPETPGVGPRDPSAYFGKGGIEALSLAVDTLAMGPLRLGIDHVMWSYSNGVWSSDKHVVERRMTRLLGQRFRSSYVGTVTAMVRSNVPTIACDPIPELINFRNGLLDWRTGELRPHSPDVPSTVQLGVEYDPTATCPAFEAFVDSVVPDDVVQTIWELIGYLMYSGNPLHKAVMLTGTGRNGKGTFLRAITNVLGARNLTSVSLYDLVATRFTTASLFGKLANIAGDIDATYMENTAVFKQITGGDTISAEHKGRDRFDFTPWATPVFSANKIPGSADTSVGYLSRWLVVPFPNDFTGREDRRLDDRLRQVSELQGIAARGIAALGGLLERGDFMLTASGELAREEFVRRVDQVRTWIADCCSIHLDHPFIPRTELYQAYKQWAFRDGHKHVKATEFYDRVEQGGARPVTVHGVRGFKHIAVYDNGLAGPVAAPWVPASPSPADAIGPNNPVCAPTPQGVVSAGQVDEIHSRVHKGAETPHPPIARDAQVGGLGNSCTPAPKPDPDVSATSKRGSGKASETAAAKRAEQRAAAIAEAAGPDVELPALVLRDGSVTSVELDHADQLLGTITGQEGGGTLTVDVEHTGYPIGHVDYELRTVQLGNETLAIVLDPHDEHQADVVRRHLAAAGVLHAHSATADLVPLDVGVDGRTLLERGAEDAWARMVDTGVLAKLADPNSTSNDADLKSLAKSVLGDYATSPAADEARAELFKAGKWLTEVKVTTPAERSGWAQVDPRSTTMVRYAASDVLDDGALAGRLEQPPAEVLAREKLAQRMTARVTHQGIRIDRDQVELLLEQHRAGRLEHGETVRGFDIDNPGSSQQIGRALTALGAQLPATRAGNPSVAKGVIETMQRTEGPVGDLVRAVLAWRHHNTALTLLLEPWHELVTRGDGRARPTIYTLGARTGRMSCVRPNVQQVSREGGMRACFTADPGEKLISVDFAGVELRVAAALSQDHGLAAIMANPDKNQDLHWQTARLAFGPGATKSDRYAIKRGVFGRLYGGGVGAVAAGVGVSHPVAKQVIDAMDTLTPVLRAWSDSIRDGIDAGRVQFRSYNGRIIHLPRQASHAGGNYCIQGTARELLIDALERWSRTRWGGCRLFPVHDEVVAFVPEHEADEATAALVECMTSELFGVPIIAEASEPSFEWRDSV